MRYFDSCNKSETIRLRKRKTKEKGLEKKYNSFKDQIHSQCND